ncbi:hypothetical protein H1C71_015418, partial [Ictidomys tridecemlineatus]
PGPQANQERLSRYKASQSGGGAPFPHSLPSQIVTMGTITKKTAPKCNHFPVNFYPRPCSAASTPLLPLTSVPWFLEGAVCVRVCVRVCECPGPRGAGRWRRACKPPPKTAAAMLQCRQTIGQEAFTCGLVTTWTGQFFPSSPCLAAHFQVGKSVPGISGRGALGAPPDTESAREAGCSAVGTHKPPEQRTTEKELRGPRPTAREDAGSPVKAR